MEEGGGERGGEGGEGRGVKWSRAEKRRREGGGAGREEGRGDIS